MEKYIMCQTYQVLKRTIEKQVKGSESEGDSMILQRMLGQIR